MGEQTEIHEKILNASSTSELMSVTTSGLTRTTRTLRSMGLYKSSIGSSSINDFHAD